MLLLLYFIFVYTYQSIWKIHADRTTTTLHFLQVIIDFLLILVITLLFFFISHDLLGSLTQVVHHALNSNSI